jgi:hypothetical protein
VFVGCHVSLGKFVDDVGDEGNDIFQKWEAKSGWLELEQGKDKQLRIER